MGQTEQALACLDKAVIIDKSFAEAHYRRGLLLKELGKTKIALLSFQNDIKHNPKATHSMYERAIIFIDQNDLEAASKELDAAISVDGMYFKAYL